MTNHRKLARGFTLMELLIAMAIGLTMTAIAVPIVQSTMRILRLNGAVASASGAISGARYQAIMHGYPYAVAFNKNTTSYQLSNEPGGAPAAFVNVGNSIPLSGSSGVLLNASTTLQFNPNGTVTATTGAMTFTITYLGLVKTITVSGVGHVQVQ
ncbi:MAG: GspH/FimT family pseudopilin [Candidatus Acidiferrales bacterium]